MSDRMVRIGIVGFGRIGAEHAGWIGKARGVEVAGVLDETEARRTIAVERGLKVVGSLEELLAGVDGVLVAVPTAMHFGVAMRALVAGKHVMVEKPMGLDLEESQKMVKEANRQGVVLSVFQNRRWDVDYLTVLEGMRSGVFGKVINVESRLGQYGSCVGPAAREYRPGWRNEKAYGGGGLYDWGSHFVDQLWRMMLPAKPVQVFAQLRGNVWTTECDDFARVCIDFDDGAVGMVEINTTTMTPLPRWQVDGTAGSAQGPYSLEFDTNRWAEVEFVPIWGENVRLSKADGAVLTEVAIWERFASAIRGEDKPAVTAESVLPTMALLDAARASTKSGSVVRMDKTIDWIE
ncbi:MAG TPA: Gfo/Idh/MocA family oxidoreductase [Tepidisphaeraceae bacterium]|nr:Gfo/Idh/MocA family oxidoreductase [Tepidisphaeraceae bacterium]